MHGFNTKTHIAHNAHRGSFFLYFSLEGASGIRSSNAMGNLFCTSCKFAYLNAGQKNLLLVKLGETENIKF